MKWVSILVDDDIVEQLQEAEGGPEVYFLAIHDTTAFGARPRHAVIHELGLEHPVPGLPK